MSHDMCAQVDLLPPSRKLFSIIQPYDCCEKRDSDFSNRSLRFAPAMIGFGGSRAWMINSVRVSRPRLSESYTRYMYVRPVILSDHEHLHVCTYLPS